ncbi:SDR family oxidoreductase [Azospirillum sp. A1-3]|uniref:SDR family NAD(P)-dependent oxidoreductase n=1 Tax=Azospirillum sp. A1-3 TaxID=185874 RepID=UPI002077409C|nr:SDR family oxidoreductase [Azospirillum sp. A1-3]MCM8737674.1 SDR family oxidoreductase [Azospirillum sp. A1-3]
MQHVHLSGPPCLEGQVAVVTGAAGGIGRATALALAQAGARVLATDIHASAVFDHERIDYQALDVTSRASVEQTVKDTIEAYGRIDILILCAGTISHRPLMESTDDEWQSILDVNLMGVVHPVRAVMPVMERQGYGKMVALGSIAAKIGGVASGPSYVAAKSAVHGLMKWVAKAGAAKGVYASIVAPGPVETPMWETVTQKAAPSANGNVPLGRFGQPDDIAQAIVFLASPQSNWITGTVLDVNGGMLMD